MDKPTTYATLADLRQLRVGASVNVVVDGHAWFSPTTAYRVDRVGEWSATLIGPRGSRPSLDANVHSGRLFVVGTGRSAGVRAVVMASPAGASAPRGTP